MSTRRQFLLTTAAAGMGYWVAGGLQAKPTRSPNERIAFASIGVGGKGGSDSEDAGRAGDMVAICDVDDHTLNNAGRNRFPKAKKFNDFRKMLDEMGKSIDAVTVSTPDHCHALAAAMALKMKKHCFVQKPLTHSIHEARVLAQLARESGVATEMGNQGTANDGLRRAAALVKAGVLGDVKEVHVWTNRPIWPQGENRPQSVDPPENLHWDLWLAGAPARPYGDNAYHPFKWRGWWDFGSGALGDMACHTLNLPFAALDLRDPIAVQAESSGHNGDCYPKWSIISFDFPANEKRGPVQGLLVRRRQAAARGSFRSKVPEPHRPGRSAARWQKGQDLRARRLRRALRGPRQGRDAGGRLRAVAGPLRRVGPCHQGRRTGHVQLPRLRRPAHRDDPAWATWRSGPRPRARARNWSGTRRN